VPVAGIFNTFLRYGFQVAQGRRARTEASTLIKESDAAAAAAAADAGGDARKARRAEREARLAARQKSARTFRAAARSRSQGAHRGPAPKRSATTPYTTNLVQSPALQLFGRQSAEQKCACAQATQNASLPPSARHAAQIAERAGSQAAPHARQASALTKVGGERRAGGRPAAQRADRIRRRARRAPARTHRGAARRRPPYRARARRRASPRSRRG